jgi:hypothetical protein
VWWVGQPQTGTMMTLEQQPFCVTHYYWHLPHNQPPMLSPVATPHLTAPPATTPTPAHLTPPHPTLPVTHILSFFHQASRLTRD